MPLVVYRITNIKNKRIYIGSTGNFEVRRAEHLGQLRTGKHCNRFLQSDFNIYKESAFIFEVIFDDFKNREKMYLKEYELILKFKGMTYNIDTNCPVLPGKEKKGKWKYLAKKVVLVKIKRQPGKKRGMSKSANIKRSPRFFKVLDERRKQV